MRAYAIPTPAYVVEEIKLRENLEILKRVQDDAGIDIILALKAFAMWRLFPFIRGYLHGAAASSLSEARLISEEMGEKAHTYSPAYIPSEFDEILSYSQCITFNSLSQWERFGKIALERGRSLGLRVNPEYSDVATDLYNPCAGGSRLGVLSDQLGSMLPEGITGLHFHTLCESDSYGTERLIEAFEKRFSRFMNRLQWVNMGGGHLITRKGYDLDHFISVMKGFRKRWPNIRVIIEPGSAVAWETGNLVTTILDIVESSGIKTALLDVSFAAHMPDTLEMPYRPRVVGADEKAEKGHLYRLGGVSCLAGDVMEVYGFDKLLHIGDRIVFQDMIHYTMVKTTMFNGVTHPSILLLKESGEVETVKRFTFFDYRSRLS